MRPYVHMADYFEKYGRKEPTTQTHNPFSYGFGDPEATCWEIMNRDPERMKAFMQSMSMMEKILPITGMYDFAWTKEVVEKDAERVILVDVGGGKGHAVREITKENPFLPTERCVVQDTPLVIEEAKRLDDPELKGVNFIAHDFHKEQPVKGEYCNNPVFIPHFP